MWCKRTVAVRLLTEQSEFSDWRPSLRTTAQWRAAPGEWPVPSAENRYAEWVDLVGRLLERPLTELPVTEIALQLRRSTDATAVSYNWRDHPGRPGVRAWLPDEPPAPAAVLDSVVARTYDYVTGAELDDHPLVRWAGVVGIAPQTLSAVPPAIADHRSRSACRSVMRPLGVEEQLAIPLVAAGRQLRSFVVARDSIDFSPDAVSFANRIQPSLRGLARQVDVVRRWRAGQAGPGPPAAADSQLAEVGLTGRELAVLQLLGEGLKAATVARRLGVTPRTVHKHLQHVYAKLGTSDRLAAVTSARRRGILPDR